MAEFVANTQEIINRGDPITVENRCKHLFSAGTGIVFHKNGEYIVTVNDHKIIVEESRFARPAYFSECLNVPRKSNADRIRAMTDEELADAYVESVACFVCPMTFGCDGRKIGKDACKAKWLDWLKQEVES